MQAKKLKYTLYRVQLARFYCCTVKTKVSTSCRVLKEVRVQCVRAFTCAVSAHSQENLFQSLKNSSQERSP